MRGGVRSRGNPVDKAVVLLDDTCDVFLLLRGDRLNKRIDSFEDPALPNHEGWMLGGLPPPRPPAGDRCFSSCMSSDRSGSGALTSK